jgi:S1-C subfamily serine protease
MNKIVKSILSISCAVLILGGLTACRTISAYDLAVKNGYQGTEQEWLESLHGSDGKDGEDGKDLTAAGLYETAKKNGFEGSYLEFCQEVLQVDVQNNNDVDTIASNITSVVSIYCGFKKTTYYGGIGGWGGGFGGGIPQTQYYASAGSGVVIDLDKEEGDALIVTNYHVIYDADSDFETGISDSIYLYTYGAHNGFSLQVGGGYADVRGDGMQAAYVGGAMDYDIAILKIEDSEYIKNSVISEARFASSNNVQVGEKVYAIGNPDGAGIAVTEGIISVESEYIQMTSTDGTNKVVDYRVMRTDAAINGGNSGGALFNAQGGLIGIVNAKNVSTEVDNMGYALPITQVKNICDNILENGGILKRAMLGVTVDVATAIAKYDEDGKLQVYEEFAVAEAAKNTTDSSYGLLSVGDVFLSIQINGGEVVQFNRQYQLNDMLLTVRKGDTVVLKIRTSEGVEKNVTIVFNADTHFVTYN